MKQAVIFDLDGTLWDSCEEVLYAWNAVLTREFPDSPLTMARLKQCMGKIKCDIARMIVPTDDEAERSRIIDACFDYELEWIAAHPGVLYDGVRETLEALRAMGYALCIVSNCEDGYVQAFLDGCGMRDLFEDFEMAGRTGRSKGENIRLVMERNAITAAVYVGDTTGDEAAARFAGLPFIHAAYGFGTADAPDAVIHSLCELPGILNQYL